MDAAADHEFSDFMQGRWAQLVRLGYGLTGDIGLAEDLAQTALTRAYAAWPRVRRADNPDAYVRRIMINANNSRLRSRRIALRSARAAGILWESFNGSHLQFAVGALPASAGCLLLTTAANHHIPVPLPQAGGLKYYFVPNGMQRFVRSWAVYDVRGRQLATGNWPPR